MYFFPPKDLMTCYKKSEEKNKQKKKGKKLLYHCFSISFSLSFFLRILNWLKKVLSFFFKYLIGDCEKKNSLVQPNHFYRSSFNSLMEQCKILQDMESL